MFFIHQCPMVIPQLFEILPILNLEYNFRLVNELEPFHSRSLVLTAYFSIWIIQLIEPDINVHKLNSLVFQCISTTSYSCHMEIKQCVQFSSHEWRGTSLSYTRMQKVESPAIARRWSLLNIITVPTSYQQLQLHCQYGDDVGIFVHFLLNVY